MANARLETETPPFGGEASGITIPYWRVPAAVPTASTYIPINGLTDGSFDYGVAMRAGNAAEIASAPLDRRSMVRPLAFERGTDAIVLAFVT